MVVYRLRCAHRRGTTFFKYVLGKDSFLEEEVKSSEIDSSSSCFSQLLLS